MKIRTNAQRCVVLVATALFAACSGTGNGSATPPTRGGYGSSPPPGVTLTLNVVNATARTISNDPHPDGCWKIDPGLPDTLGPKADGVVTLSPDADNSSGHTGCDQAIQLDISYFLDPRHLCTLEVDDSVHGVYSYRITQGNDTACMVSSTTSPSGSSAVFTYDVLASAADLLKR